MKKTAIEADYHYLCIDCKIGITWHEYIKVSNEWLKVAEPKAFSPKAEDWVPLERAIPDFSDQLYPQTAGGAEKNPKFYSQLKFALTPGGSRGRIRFRNHG